MSILTIGAPAKINLHLRVKNKRPDGFHELESIFFALDFGDTLYFEPCFPDGELKIEINAPPGVCEAGGDIDKALPVSQNIIFKAVCLYRERTGFQKGLKIRLEKRIPLGGGLGGGSSDAASTLLALNTLAAQASVPGFKPLEAGSLDELGAFLGSDVPFFLKECRAAWISGRGERIQALTIPARLWIVLVKPGFSSDTGEAYRMLDQFRDAHGTDREWPYTNDFLPVFLHDKRVSAIYQEILADLKAQGSGFSGLSGAGSSCFGVFTQEKIAVQAYENLKSKWNFVILTFPRGQS